MEAIFADFEQTIVPGMTHWQHPRFFAYFPANAAPVSVVAEYLVVGMAAQCMLWQTSPAATELETKMIDWLRQALGLPEGFSGVIQDSASSATLAAVLTMRERALDWARQPQGALAASRACASTAPTRSIRRSTGRSGWPASARKIWCGLPDRRALAAWTRRRSRRRSNATGGGLAAGGIIASVGGTSVGGTDDVAALSRDRQAARPLSACRRGLGRIGDDLPGIPAFLGGRRGGGFDRLQSAQMAGRAVRLLGPFRARPGKPGATLAIKPEFLKTHGRDGIINYSEWTVPLGRRFRALKLWFLLQRARARRVCAR